jgi:hypothetical protein
MFAYGADGDRPDAELQPIQRDRVLSPYLLAYVISFHNRHTFSGSLCSPAVLLWCLGRIGPFFY